MAEIKPDAIILSTCALETAPMATDHGFSRPCCDTFIPARFSHKGIHLLHLYWQNAVWLHTWTPAIKFQWCEVEGEGWSTLVMFTDLCWLKVKPWRLMTCVCRFPCQSGSDVANVEGSGPEVSSVMDALNFYVLHPMDVLVHTIHDIVYRKFLLMLCSGLKAK